MRLGAILYANDFIMDVIHYIYKGKGYSEKKTMKEENVIRSK